MFFENIISVLPKEFAWLCVMIVSMLPMLEIRSAIPFGLSGSVWGSDVLPMWQVCLFAFCGACLISIIVLLLLKLFVKLLSKSKRFEKGYKNFQNWLENKFFKFKQTKNGMGKWWVLMLFTALPLPFSGVWTACLLCCFFNMKFWWGIFSITVGNLFSTILVSLFCTVFYQFVDLVFVVFVLIAIMIAVYCFMKFVFSISHKKRLNGHKNCK